MSKDTITSKTGDAQITQQGHTTNSQFGSDVNNKGSNRPPATHLSK